MLYYKDNKWHICPYKAKYTTHGELQEKYTTDKSWWQNFVNKWWHHENLHFEPVNPTDEQFARLDEINNASIPQGFISDASAYVEYGYVQNKDSSHFDGFSDQQDAFDKFIAEKAEEIEQERIKRTEFMPYTTPDGIDVQVKVGEKPPHKPRQTWLAGTAAWGIANIQKGTPNEVDSLIAADDTSHDMTAEQWVDFGITLKSWIKDNVMAAKEHMANVRDLTTVENVQNYDTSTGWPE